jgi:hypothetical protein
LRKCSGVCRDTRLASVFGRFAMEGSGFPCQIYDANKMNE